jgi:hypothetical protein
MTQQCHPRPRLRGDKLRRRTISPCHPRAAFPRGACPRENGERGAGIQTMDSRFRGNDKRDRE